MFAVIGLASVMGSFPASAGHNDDIHSRNVRKLGQKSIEVSTISHGQRSDVAIQHKLIVADS